MSKRLQQGDVLLKKVESIPSGKKEYKSELILAYGEVTGHCHRIVWEGNRVSIQQSLPTEVPPQIRLFTVGGKTYVEAPLPFSVVHEEHKRIDVPAGDYEVHIVREWDYDTEEARNVAD